MNKPPARWILVFVVFALFILTIAACRPGEETAEPIEPEQGVVETAVLPTATAAPLQPSPTVSPKPVSDTPPTTAPPTVTPSPTPQPVFSQGETLGVLWQRAGRVYGGVVDVDDVIVFHQYIPDRALIVVDIYTGQQLNAIPLPGQDTAFAVSDGTAYLASPDRVGRLSVSAYRLNDGELLWTKSSSVADSTAKLYANENGVLVIESGRASSLATLTLLDFDGQERWRKHYQCQYPSGSLLASRYLEVNCYQKTLLLSLDDGAALQQTTIGGYWQGVAAERLLFRLYQSRESGQSGLYLEAIDVENQATLWSHWISDSDTVWQFSVYGEDIVYKDGPQVTRLDGRTGEIVWRQTVRSETGYHILPVGDLLLVGSYSGYLHILSAETGALLWEQDIWATVSSRPIYISPERWAGDVILINASHSYLALSLQGDLNWTPSTPAPSTPVPLPTATAHPILPTLVPGATPAKPTSIDEWPAAIVAFLNSDPAHVEQLPVLLEGWFADGAFPSGAVETTQVDLTGDGQLELVIAIDGGGYMNEGWLLILQGGPARDYRLLWAQPIAMPRVMTVRDLNGDGRQNIVYSETFAGAHTASVALFPIGWRNDTLVDLSNGRIRTTNADLSEVRIEDITGDGRAEIIIRGGTFGSAGAGLTRTSTFTYSWSDDGYSLLSQVPDLPQDYYFFLMDANQLLLEGSYAEAIEMFETSMFSDDALYYGDAALQRAFAEFQLVLAYLLSGDEVGAARWAASGNYPDEFYSEVKEIFWTQYQATKDWTTAAEAARARVRLAGYGKAQIIWWVGYANRPLDLNSICPCPDCLQGSIGSAFD